MSIWLFIRMITLTVVMAVYIPSVVSQVVTPRSVESGNIFSV